MAPPPPGAGPIAPGDMVPMAPPPMPLFIHPMPVVFPVKTNPDAKGAAPDAKGAKGKDGKEKGGKGKDDKTPDKLIRLEIIPKQEVKAKKPEPKKPKAADDGKPKIHVHIHH